MNKPKVTLSDAEILRQAAIIRGRSGGKSTSKAKRQSSKDNLAKARASRWPKRKEGAE